MATPADSADPMEKAIFDSASQLDIVCEVPADKEYALSKDLLAMSLAYKHEDGFMLYAKGSPEAIIELCRLGEVEGSKVLEDVTSMARRGLRVLGVATARCTDANLPENQEEMKFDFTGLIGFEDPIRDEVPEAVKECYEAGVKVVMITGDYSETAASIARQAGIDVSGGVITGDMMNEIIDEQLIHQISEVNVFARIVPEQKLRIVQALKSNNEVVAMTGDGVNDAPALKAADIGIAMGKKGTDVAREASSLVLLDDNFSSIVASIRSGRRIYDNLQKSMMYIMAIHIPIIGLTLLPAFFSILPIILMPLHIIFMELIIDPVCSLAFESEEEEAGIMKRPPRDPSYKFFGPKRIIWSVFMGTLLLLTVLGVYFYSFYEGHAEGEVRVISFATLILGNMALILTSLSKSRFVIHVLLERNIALLAILGIASVLLFSVIYVPYLRELFAFDSPGGMHFWIVFVAVFVLISILEIFKLARIRKR
jgi:Ca2+-transporting ATPase